MGARQILFFERETQNFLIQPRKCVDLRHAHQPSIQYSTLDASNSVLRHVTIMVILGRPGLTITRFLCSARSVHVCALQYFVTSA